MLYEDGTGVYTLRSWTARCAQRQRRPLDAGGDGAGAALTSSPTVCCWARHRRAASTPGTVASAASGEDVGEGAIVLFDHVAVTTRLGSTYRGLPLALTSWDAPDPATIIAELADGGHIAPVEERDLYVLERSLTVTGRTSRFEPIGTELAQYDDFVLGGRVAISTAAKCGLWPALSLAGRAQSGAGVDMAAGSAWLRRATRSLRPTSTTSAVVAPRNQLLVIAQGERLALYVNGALVAQNALPARGRVGVALLNYSVRTDCLWSEMCAGRPALPRTKINKRPPRRRGKPTGGNAGWCDERSNLPLGGHCGGEPAGAGVAGRLCRGDGGDSCCWALGWAGTGRAVRGCRPGGGNRVDCPVVGGAASGPSVMEAMAGCCSAGALPLRLRTTDRGVRMAEGTKPARARCRRLT